MQFDDVRHSHARARYGFDTPDEQDNAIGKVGRGRFVVLTARRDGACVVVAKLLDGIINSVNLRARAEDLASDIGFAGRKEVEHLAETLGHVVTSTGHDDLAFFAGYMVIVDLDTHAAILTKTLHIAPTFSNDSPAHFAFQKTTENLLAAAVLRKRVSMVNRHYAAVGERVACSFFGRGDLLEAEGRRPPSTTEFDKMNDE